MSYSAPPYTTNTINGLCIRQIIAGDKTAPPVLMLHGWGTDSQTIWPLGQRLVTLGYRIYAPDLPGFGKSDLPPVAWTVFDYARFVLAYADSQHLECFYLFGHSFGGRLGLILGAEHPERILKMTLADSAGIRQSPPLLPRIRLHIYKGLRDRLQVIGLGRVSERLRRWYNRRYGSTDFQNATGIMRETFIKVVNVDLREYAQQVQAPTLLIWGDQDTDTPLWQGQLLEQLIPDAGLVIFPGAGHFSYLENLPQAAKAIAALFQSPTELSSKSTG